MPAKLHLELIATMDDADINLVDGALTLAGFTEPGFDAAPYRRHADQLRDDVAAYVGNDDPTVDMLSEALAQVLNRRYGYTGVTDPAEFGDGANLARTIDRRRGGALALCILYAHAADGLARRWDILEFPARALLRIEDVHGVRRVLDPFEGADALDAPALRHLHRTYLGGDGEIDPFSLTPLSRRTVLVSLQDDVKTQALRQAAPEAAQAALEAALLLAPDTPRLWREAGLLHARLDQITEAIGALERFLALPGGDVHRYTASQLLQQLHNRQTPVS